jgi:hypothetical protein
MFALVIPLLAAIMDASTVDLLFNSKPNGNFTDVLL